MSPTETYMLWFPLTSFPLPSSPHCAPSTTSTTPLWPCPGFFGDKVCFSSMSWKTTQQNRPQKSGTDSARRERQRSQIRVKREGLCSRLGRVRRWADSSRYSQRGERERGGQRSYIICGAHVTPTTNATYTAVVMQRQPRVPRKPMVRNRRTRRSCSFSMAYSMIHERVPATLFCGPQKMAMSGERNVTRQQTDRSINQSINR